MGLGQRHPKSHISPSALPPYLPSSTHPARVRVHVHMLHVLMHVMCVCVCGAPPSWMDDMVARGKTDCRLAEDLQMEQAKNASLRPAVDRGGRGMGWGPVW